MPGNNAASLVKCEPSSGDDDSNSQFHHKFHCSQLNVSELRPASLELNSQRNEHLLQHLQACSVAPQDALEELALAAPAGPAATPVCVKQEPAEAASATFETLESTPWANSGSTLLERHMAMLGAAEMPDSSNFMPLVSVKDEPLSEGEQHSQSGEESAEPSTRSSPKGWTQKDMDNALAALRDHNMSLTKASATYGIPSTTLWQRAHRLGIDTPKKEGSAKSWGEADLRRALHALRAGAISANKASKAYGIPSSTLYKIARREGIRLSAPFNAAPVAWRRADLARALEAIRAGDSSVQRAAAQYGIPTGTLYGRCKREGIELSRANPTPWSEGAMGDALEAVRVGQMSINQAAIHYNLPYSSLYGRFKRCKHQPQSYPPAPDVHIPPDDLHSTQEAREPDHHQPQVQETHYFHQPSECSIQHQYLHQHTGYHMEAMSFNMVQQDAHNLHGAGAPLYYASCHAPS